MYDLLNYGDPAPLRAALVQLDGEIYADYSSIAIGAGQLFLGAVRTQMRAANQAPGPVQQWLSAISGGGVLSGNGDSHSVNSAIGGLAETQEMLDFCGKHNITSDVEVIPIQQINEAFERMLKSDVKYRFSIDMASLQD